MCVGGPEGPGFPIRNDNNNNNRTTQPTARRMPHTSYRCRKSVFRGGYRLEGKTPSGGNVLLATGDGRLECNYLAESALARLARYVSAHGVLGYQLVSYRWAKDESELVLTA